ncbi:MAG: hypothetical protein NPINA01_17420 [Nitrospinaceae bacterium]|nr:MAG: hypothetical protein NPINA01_17420 [Nitrospinaceae bacterium]
MAIGTDGILVLKATVMAITDTTLAGCTSTNITAPTTGPIAITTAAATLIEDQNIMDTSITGIITGNMVPMGIGITDIDRWTNSP